MKNILKTALTVLGVGVILVLHILVRNFLPVPFNYIHIIFLTIILFHIFNPDSSIVFFLLLPTFLLELFSVSPFGLNTLALFISLFIINKTLRYLFTNYSYYMVGMISLLGMLCYRVLFSMLIFFSYIFFKTNFSISTETAKEWFYELCLTTIFIILFYLLISFFTKRSRPHYVSLNKEMVQYE